MGGENVLRVFYNHYLPLPRAWGRASCCTGVEAEILQELAAEKEPTPEPDRLVFPLHRPLGCLLKKLEMLMAEPRSTALELGGRREELFETWRSLCSVLDDSGMSDPITPLGLSWPL